MEAWDTLVPVIVDYLTENRENNLKQLFLMIKANLIHAELGILERLDDGFEKLVDLNTWLFYTTIKALSNTTNDEG